MCAHLQQQQGQEERTEACCWPPGPGSSAIFSWCHAFDAGSRAQAQGRGADSAYLKVKATTTGCPSWSSCTNAFSPRNSTTRLWHSRRGSPVWYLPHAPTQQHRGQRRGGQEGVGRPATKFLR